VSSFLDDGSLTVIVKAAGVVRTFDPGNRFVFSQAVATVEESKQHLSSKQHCQSDMSK